MGMIGPNGLLAERACREYQIRDGIAARKERAESRGTKAETVAANPEADAVKTPMAISAKTGDQAIGLVETAVASHGLGARMKRAWASITGTHTTPGTTPESSDK